MSKGFNTRLVPYWVANAIEESFKSWEQMSGDWLHTAPEYLITVCLAQKLQREIPSSHQAILLEPGVKGVMKEAGGVQRGPVASHLRNRGRFDLVLCRGNRVPRVVVEIKNPLWAPLGKYAVKDLKRLCHAVLSGRKKTKIYSGVLGFYTSSGPTKNKDACASDRLRRRWLTEWRPALQSWAWAGPLRGKYAKHLLIDVGLRIHTQTIDGEEHAWAAVCVEVRRKSGADKAANGSP